jgi:hypothetical protein
MMRSLWWLPLLFTLGCDRALDLPGGEAQAPGQPQCPSTLGCDVPLCSEATDAASCELRSECYAEYSLDEMCDSAGCNSHFVACEMGTIDCHVEVSCTIQPPHGTCDTGFVEVVGADGCSWFCVRASLCGPCALRADQGSCESDPACHARFDDANDCFNGPCVSYTRCEDGAAICSPGAPTPSCTEMVETCDTVDHFVPAYFANGCPDGCVRSQDCPLSNGP